MPSATQRDPARTSGSDMPVRRGPAHVGSTDSVPAHPDRSPKASLSAWQVAQGGGDAHRARQGPLLVSQVTEHGMRDTVPIRPPGAVTNKGGHPR